MKKIPTLFVRNPEDRRYVLPEVTPGCEWVLAGEGVATQKYDGTCVMLDEDGRWWARREVKDGKHAPAGFVGVEYDMVTRKRVGWEPIERSPFAKFHAEALGNPSERRHVGTYELVGPKVNGNPERTESHELIRHADAVELTFATPGQDDAPGDFWHYMQGFMSSLRSNGVEGIVWHHPDGRMAKLKARDFPTERDGEAQR